MMSTSTITSVNKSRVFFERRELNLVLSLYGRMVSAGEWRDYAMDALDDRAVFSIFRRASEAPLYQVEKRPALARKQGAFVFVWTLAVIGAVCAFALFLRFWRNVPPYLTWLSLMAAEAATSSG